MANVYLVDSENIGASWSQLLASMSKEDRMYVFYTDKSPYISYENLLQVIAHCEIPVFLKCYEGKNALDFQLVSELGFKLCQDPEAEFIIVSDDYGYDAAVRYWSERKYNVRRIGKKYCRPVLPKRDNVAVQSEVRTVQVEERKAQPVQIAEPFSEEVMNAPVISEKENEQAIPEEQVKEQPEAEQAVLVEQTVAAEQPDTDAQPVTEEQAGQEAPQKSQKDNQNQKRSRDRRKKHKKEAAKDPDKAAGTSTEENAAADTVIAKDSAESAEQQREANGTKAEPVMVEQITTEQVQTEQDQAEQDQSEQVQTEQEKNEQGQTEQNQAEQEKAEQDQTEQDQYEQEKTEQDQTEQGQIEQKENEEFKLDFQILDMVKRCGSPEPEKDARCVKELFCTLSMCYLTCVIYALTSLIGNELGNDIYRELKEHQECREQLDALYCPAVKNRFIHYVQIVLDRSQLEGVTAEELGNFLLRIPRKNLNSIRSAMMKEFGHDLGAEVYTVFKTHIKVLNKI